MVTCRIAGLLLVVSLAASARAAHGTSGPCGGLTADMPVRVGTQRIGPFPTTVPLDSLRALCPRARPTLGYGFETAWAALDLGIGDLRILAAQNWLLKPLADAPDVPDPVVDWSRAPSHWVVSGCGGVLPRGVSSCATWQEVTAAYGTAGSGNAEFGPVGVRLDALPGFTMRLDVTDDVVGAIEVHGDLSRIPNDARIVELIVAPR